MTASLLTCVPYFQEWSKYVCLLVVLALLSQWRI